MKKNDCGNCHHGYFIVDQPIHCGHEPVNENIGYYKREYTALVRCNKNNIELKHDS